MIVVSIVFSLFLLARARRIGGEAVLDRRSLFSLIRGVKGVVSIKHHQPLLFRFTCVDRLHFRFCSSLFSPFRGVDTRAFRDGSKRRSFHRNRSSYCITHLFIQSTTRLFHRISSNKIEEKRRPGSLDKNNSITRLFQ